MLPESGGPGERDAGGPSDHDRLVASLDERVRRFVRDIDLSILTGPEANQELTAVLPLAAGPAADREAAAAAGTVAWLGYLAQDSRDVRADTVLVARAAGLFVPVYAAAPARVPEPLRELLQVMPPQRDKFLLLCARWCEANMHRKGLMLLKDVVTRINDTPTGRAESLARLSDFLWHQPGNPASLSSAIVAMTAALGEAPAGYPGRVQMAAMLGNQFQDRAVGTGSGEDLDSAIEHLRTAASLAATTDPGRRPSVLSDLSGALQDRYRERFGPADLQEALATSEQAVAEAPGRALVVHNYAGALMQKFWATGDLADRAAAMSRQREALRLTPKGGGTGRAVMLTSLAAALRSGYRQTRSAAELDEAIGLGREALDELDPRDVANRAYCCGTLGSALFTRFQESGQQADLTDAIEFCRIAVEGMPAGGSRRALWLSNYGGALRARYTREGNLADLITAIDLIRQAAAATPLGHPNRAMYVINVSNATQELCRVRMSVPALEAASADLREVLDHVADRPAPMLAALLAGRGSVLTTLHEQAAEAADIDEAVRCCRQAVQLAADSGGPHADYQANLASALLAKAKSTGEVEDQAAALAALLGTAFEPAAHVRARIFAMRAAAGMMASDGELTLAARMLARAVELVTRAVPRRLARADQVYWLGQFGDLAAEAAARAIAALDPQGAVTVLELGRGVLIGQSLQLRDAVGELRDTEPELAGRLERIRAELDAPAAPLPAAEPGTLADTVAMFDASRAAAARRVELTAELGRLTDQIRKRPGMAGFLRRPAFGDVAAAASEGPVIFLNVSQLGSHALVLTPSGAEPVPLPKVTPGAVAAQVADAGDPASLGEVLDWLWDAVAAPVLTSGIPALASGDGGQPPRVWWSPVGSLSFLPVHAAASKADGTPGALDLVVSSYTPTVAALAQARSRERRPAGDDDMLVVAMPVTPGGTDLPGAAAEADWLTAGFRVGQVLGSWPGAAGQATRATVTDALPRHAFAHFACHASCDTADPAASALYLQDPSAAPLTMADILALDIDGGSFAFLSACETALTTEALANEALHLVTAFGLAGYPQVIGTLWKIADSAGSIMTEQIYQGMRPPGEPGERCVPRADQAARALHDAALALRAQFPGHPFIWAAHIHAGA